jgi:hypothetical protein
MSDEKTYLDDYCKLLGISSDMSGNMLHALVSKDRHIKHLRDLVLDLLMCLEHGSADNSRITGVAERELSREFFGIDNLIVMKDE